MYDAFEAHSSGMHLLNFLDDEPATSVVARGFRQKLCAAFRM